MQKIVPFKKEIIFKNNLSEITSISLEHNFSIKEMSIVGEFILSGEYKITNQSETVEPFSYNLPFEIRLDEKYIIDNATVDIDDFYYEIVNDKVLIVNIELLIDNLDEKEPVIFNEDEIEEQRCVEEENYSVNSIIEEIENEKDAYRSYSVYIVREGDTIEAIIEKYNTTKEELLDYNDLSEIKIGDKIIIPCNV